MYLYSILNNFTNGNKYILVMLSKPHYVCHSAMLHVICKSAESQHQIIFVSPILYRAIDLHAINRKVKI